MGLSAGSIPSSVVMESTRGIMSGAWSAPVLQDTSAVFSAITSSLSGPELSPRTTQATNTVYTAAVMSLSSGTQCGLSMSSHSHGTPIKRYIVRYPRGTRSTILVSLFSRAPAIILTPIPSASRVYVP